jgi:2-dehydro-3-deoxy-L-rhamnonate dehydrogenase (NAD+)
MEELRYVACRMVLSRAADWDYRHLPALTDPAGKVTIRRSSMSRTAIVTGGASGLGRATALRLAADGLRVVTLDIARTADVVVDITDSEAVAAAVAHVGAVDVLVNSAGIVGPNAPLWEIDDSDWIKTFDVNVRGTLNACRAVVPGMIDRGWGRIVNFSSMAGKDGNPNLSAYSASKAAVIAMTKSLGKELATSGVLVNAIAPAVFDTPMNAATAPDVLAYITSLIPMRRVGKAEEVAELVAWLASDKCSFSTGAVYDISGGRATY